jgi:cation diffusion facilitator CzcD-associated flavoprotein CzcO
MYTLGYVFRPWMGAKAIADGPSILSYVRAAAEEGGIDKKIRFRHRVKRASWCSRTARWTVEAETGSGTRIAVRCRFLLMCTGYYDYAEGHNPRFDGEADFQGEVIHAQHWPETLDYAGKRVVVIGSGATAVTLVPEMAKRARSVVMLQRSPTYVVSRPAEDALANWLRSKLPASLAYSIVRWRNVLLGMFFFNLARKKPEETKQRLLGLVRQELGLDYDVATHFTPRYNPWDQRLCLVPDADLFKAIREGRAEVVTDQVDAFLADGVRLKSGRFLAADLIVKATGLKLQLMSGMEVVVDGQMQTLSRALSYKGMMFSDVPNLASVFGYTNASWTLKADLTAAYVCRLLNHMRRKNLDICVPRRSGEEAEAPWLDFSSGYVLRALSEFPKQGAEAPWKVHQNYAKDLLALRFGGLEDGVMRFARAEAAPELPEVSPPREREPIAAE